MEIKIDKKFFIKFGIIIILCFACFCTGRGRFLRIRGASEDGIRAEQQVEQLSDRVRGLEAELRLRIEQCEQLEGQLNSIGDGLDESIRAAGSIRDDIKRGTEELRGSNQIIAELRKRFTQYEIRIGELTEDLRRIKEGTSK